MRLTFPPASHPRCACSGHGAVIMLDPFSVERCDSCKRFPDDDEAGRYVAAVLGVTRAELEERLDDLAWSTLAEAEEAVVSFVQDYERRSPIAGTT